MISLKFRVGSVAILMLIAAALMPIENVDAADAEPSTWTGFYIGAHAGYGWFDAKAGNNTPDLGADGPMGGVFLGYNWDMGSHVLGLEADAAFGDQSDQVPVVGFGTVKLTNHGQHTFRARAGMKVADNDLLYITVGLALADYWAKAGTGQQDKNFLLGGVVGGGYEVRLTQNLLARSEYLYANYGDQTFDIGAATSIDVDSHTFRFGIAWQF